MFPARAAVIFVDVDDTLVRSFGSKRIPMTGMVKLVRDLHACDVKLYCWSSGGADYARSSADGLGLVDCIQAFLPKPQMQLDDVRLQQWKLQELHPAECHGRTTDEIPEMLAR